MSQDMSPEEARQMEATKTMILRKIMSKAAMERLARVKMVKPDIATQLEAYLLSLYQSGKIKTEVSEEQMKAILETISGASSAGKFNIVRK